MLPITFNALRHRYDRAGAVGGEALVAVLSEVEPNKPGLNTPGVAPDEATEMMVFE